MRENRRFLELPFHTNSNSGKLDLRSKKLSIYFSSPTPTSLLRLKVHIIGRSSGAMMVILIYCAVVHQGWTTDLPHMRRIRHAKTFFFKPHQIQTQPDEVGNSTILCSL